MRLFPLLIFTMTVFAQSYKQVGSFAEGGEVGAIPTLVYDANNDGHPELYYYYDESPGNYYLCIREYRHYNRYIKVETFEYLYPHYIGNLDGDAEIDLLTSWDKMYAYEPPFPNSYPTQLVWQSDSNGLPMHVDDLDQDGKVDFILIHRGIEIYENNGDNQYDMVWKDDTTAFGGGNYISGDFDQDGKIEFVTGSYQHYPCSLVYECVGDNQYEFIFCDTIYPSTANSHDVWYGNDLDQDGKIEFIIGSAPASGGSWAYQFRVYESIADNLYAVSYTSDIVYRPFILPLGRRSYCADVNLDGQDEIIWAVQDNWYIYKAFGNNNFQRVFTAYPSNNWHDETGVFVYDLNGNGYPEIIETGFSWGPWTGETVIWEIEAVRLIYPNGGEIFQPQDTIEVKWQTFDPPGCDSLSLFFSSDSGYNYDTIVTGIPASDSTYQWIVPDTTSDKCMLMIWAYGPGIGWDFTDSIFAISVGVSEEGSKHTQKVLKIYPNPSYGRVNLDLPNDIIEINLFDAAGRQIKRFQPTQKLKIKLSPGIYFLQIKTQTQTKTEKIVILK